MHYDIKNEHLIFKMPTKNHNTNYKRFYKLVYSDRTMAMSYILVKMNYLFYDLVYNKYNNSFLLKIYNNDIFFQKIRLIETTILYAANAFIKKNIAFNCFNELVQKPYIYCFHSFPSLQHLTLKISGVWESETHIGLVYKLCYNTSTEKLSKISC